jgi:hypothetical protein
MTDSEVEEFLGKGHKDASRAPKPKPKPRNKRDKNVRPTATEEEADGEDVPESKETKPTTASHALMLTAMTYRIGFVKEDYPHDNEFIPDATTMFGVLSAMLTTVSQNSRLHEVYPAYNSMATYLYHAHAVFYHILRARSDAGRLERIERRALRAYEQIGPAESWPIATPLIGYFQAMGHIIPDGGKYGRIIPAVPNFSKLTEKKGLQGLHSVIGGGRLPIVPAYHQFLHNYGAKTAKFNADDGFLYPNAAKELDNTAGRRFVGLVESTASSADFQALAFSAGWNEPKEAEIDTFVMNDTQKRTIVSRWGIVAHENATADLRTLDEYLGLTGAMKPHWMVNLLKGANALCKFFPGSTTLNEIPLLSRVENVSHIKVDLAPNQTAEAGQTDRWWTARQGWRVSLTGKVLRDDSQIAFQMAIGTMVRTDYTEKVKPTIIGDAMKDRIHDVKEGYFHESTAPRTEMFCEDQIDPIELASAIIDSKMYDRFGGESK